MTSPGGYLHDLLDSVDARSATALVDRSGSWAFSDLQDWSHRIAGWLRSRGVSRGDRVLVRASADKRIYGILHACSRVGAIFVPVSPHLKPYQEAQIVQDADPKLAVGAAVEVSWPTLDAAWDDIARAGGAGSDRNDDASRPESPRDPLILFYTSGSTAQPKGVVAPHAQIVFAAGAIHERLQYERDDVVYCHLPLNFDYGLYQGILATFARCSVVLADETVIDPAREIVEHQATVVPVVPTLAAMIGRFAKRRDPIRHVRLFTNTGDALSHAAIRLLKESFPAAAVQLMYGLTECKRVSILEHDGYLARPGAVGRPLRGTSVHIVGNDGFAIPAGNVGEIVVAGPHLTDGYWRDAELTQRTFGISPETGERTLSTGDLGYCDNLGYIYIEGRKDQIFKQRGIRTSVAEVEAAALDIPGVHEAALVPPRRGGKARLFVVADVEASAVLRGIEERLGGAKLPDECHLVAALPHGSTGKVDRNALGV